MFIRPYRALTNSKPVALLRHWQHHRWRPWAKIISLVISFSFLFPFFTWAFESANYNPGGLKPVHYHERILAIPSQYGVIHEAWPAGKQVVVHIQDLHCNYEVQTNIARIIDDLAAQYDLKLVTIEGACSVVNTSKLGTFPVAEVKARVGQTLIQQGLIGGPEYYAATGRHKIFLEGIENRALYQQNLKNVQSFLNAESQGDCCDLREALDKLKAKVYSEPLKQFDGQRMAFCTGKMPMPQYGASLLEIARQNQIAAPNCPNLRAYLEKNQSLPPGNVDPDALDAELNWLDRQIRVKLYTSRAQADLDRLYHQVDVIEKLINVSATPEELAEFKTNRNGYAMQTFVDFIRQQDPAGPIATEQDIYGLDGYLESVESFYQVVDQRSGVFVENVLSRMKKHQTDLVVVVSGGYHTAGIREALKAKGVSFVSVMPRLQHQDIVNPYYQLLQNRRSPLEKLLAQNQNLIALPVGTDVKEAYADQIVTENNVGEALDDPSPEALSRALTRLGETQVFENSVLLARLLEQGSADLVATYREEKTKFPAEFEKLELALEQINAGLVQQLRAGKPVILSLAHQPFSEVMAPAKAFEAPSLSGLQPLEIGGDERIAFLTQAQAADIAPKLMERPYGKRSLPTRRMAPRLGNAAAGSAMQILGLMVLVFLLALPIRVSSQLNFSVGLPAAMAQTAPVIRSAEDVQNLAAKRGVLNHRVLSMLGGDVSYWYEQVQQGKLTPEQLDQRFAAMRAVLDLAGKYGYALPTQGDLSYWVNRFQAGEQAAIEREFAAKGKAKNKTPVKAGQSGAINSVADVRNLAAKRGVLNHRVLSMQGGDVGYWYEQVQQGKLTPEQLDQRFAAMRAVLDLAGKYGYALPTQGDLSYWVNRFQAGEQAAIEQEFAAKGKLKNKSPGSGATKERSVPSPAPTSSGTVATVHGQRTQVTAEQKAELQTMLTDGLAQMQRLVDSKTGWPMDRANMGRNGLERKTTIDNVGILLTNLSGAAQAGIMPKDAAQAGVLKALATLDRYQAKYSQFGVPFTWVSLDKLDSDGLPVPDNHNNSLIDGGNLYLSVIVAQQAFPQNTEIQAHAAAILKRFQFQAYKTPDGMLYGAWENGKMNTGWILGGYNESFTAYLPAVGLGVLPPSSIDKKAQKDGGPSTYYGFAFHTLGQPGVKAGGLFLPGMPRIYLAGTEYDEELAQMTAAEMANAKVNNYPVWGTSASADPNSSKYLGYGDVVPTNVNPHAAVLPLELFPRLAAENLIKLQGLGVITKGGPLDAYSVTTHKLAPTTTGWDLGMYNAGLMNYLYGGVIRNLFTSNPFVQRAIGKIPAYQSNPGKQQAFEQKLDNIENQIETGSFDKSHPMPQYVQWREALQMARRIGFGNLRAEYGFLGSVLGTGVMLVVAAAIWYAKAAKRHPSWPRFGTGEDMRAFRDFGDDRNPPALNQNLSLGYERGGAIYLDQAAMLCLPQGLRALMIEHERTHLKPDQNAEEDAYRVMVVSVAKTLGFNRLAQQIERRAARARQNAAAVGESNSSVNATAAEQPNTLLNAMGQMRPEFGRPLSPQVGLRTGYTVAAKILASLGATVLGRTFVGQLVNEWALQANPETYYLQHAPELTSPVMRRIMADENSGLRSALRTAAPDKQQLQGRIFRSIIGILESQAPDRALLEDAIRLMNLASPTTAFDAGEIAGQPFNLPSRLWDQDLRLLGRFGFLEKYLGRFPEIKLAPPLVNLIRHHVQWSAAWSV